MCAWDGTRLAEFLPIANRRQCVSIAGMTSGTCSVQFGIPQGSAFGPQLFSVYTRPLGSLICSHGLDHEFYADDSQLCVFVRNDLCRLRWTEQWTECSCVSVTSASG